MDAKFDVSALEGFAERLEQAPGVLKKAKRQALETAALRLQSAVQYEIGGSGRVRDWQGSFVGTKGGYAAARPKKETYIETKGRQKGFRAGPKKYAVGYVTNAINSGHRKPKNAWGYRTSAGTVAGKHFYEAAQAPAEQVGKEAADQVAQALIDHLEG